MTFVGIQSGYPSEVYISAVSYSGEPEPPPPACEIPNESFEEGQLDESPPSWDIETECIGPGATCTHEAWAINTHYFDGSRSLYIHSRVVDGGTADSYSSNTTAWTADWINCPEAAFVKFCIRGIASDHTPTHWGWSNTIDVRFKDGENSNHVSVYCHGETCNWNDYCDTLQGVDGSIWYVYNVAIPASIDKTHMKIGIQNHAHCWTWYGYYADLKFYVDMVELVKCGDVSGDGEVDISDVVYLIGYLFRNGPAPNPVEVGDVTCDGEVDVGDVVSLISYLFRNGPPPCDCKGNTYPGSGSELYKGRAPVQIGLTSPTISKDGTFEVPVVCKSEVDVAAVQLGIKYDPQQIVLLEPVLSPRIDGLQIYSSAKDGLAKIGILNISGESYISAGTGALFTLRGKGSDLSSLEITRAILVDPDAHKIPVQIVPEVRKSEDDATDEGSAVPQEFSLSQNYPNPFNPQTSIRYALPQDAHVKLTIYNVLGQKVVALVDEHQPAGYKTIWWDGKDDKGEQVSSGVYFYRLEAGTFSEAKKMLLMK
jgi:hypothetical protein